MKKILVAEDEQNIREFVVINLKRAGYDCVEAASGEEALRVYEQAGGDFDVAVLDIILRDEIGHVRIGNHWYGWLCARQGLDPVAHYAHLIQTYQAPRLRAPFNQSARLAAGFSPEELAQLSQTAMH